MITVLDRARAGEERAFAELVAAHRLEGLTMIDPGLTPITRWHAPDPAAEHIDAYGAVARKP